MLKIALESVWLKLSNWESLFWYFFNTFATTLLYKKLPAWHIPDEDEQGSSKTGGTLLVSNSLTDFRMNQCSASFLNCRFWKEQ